MQSPAPPFIALVGLLAGEAAMGWLRGHPQVIGWMNEGRTLDAGASRDPRHLSWRVPSRTRAAAPGTELNRMIKEPGLR
jgi:hypothetical protein